MKRFLTLAIAAILMTTNAVAQKNVQRTFDKFIKSKNVQVEKNLNSQMDPFPSGKKGEHRLLSQRDIYTFTLDVSDRKLLDNILIQMEKDRGEKNCYLTRSHRGGKDIPIDVQLCRVGDSNSNQVKIGTSSMQHWMLSCYTAEEDQNYRHLYAVEWTEPTNGEREIKGRLIYTYAQGKGNQNIQSAVYNNGQWYDHVKIAGADTTSIKTEQDVLVRIEIQKVLFQKLIDNHSLQESEAVTAAAALFVTCRDYGHLLRKDQRKKYRDEIANLARQTIDQGHSPLATEFLIYAQQALRD